MQALMMTQQSLFLVQAIGPVVRLAHVDSSPLHPLPVLVLVVALVVPEVLVLLVAPPDPVAVVLLPPLPPPPPVPELQAVASTRKIAPKHGVAESSVMRASVPRLLLAGFGRRPKSIRS